MLNMVFQVYAGGFGTESKTASGKCSISSAGSELRRDKGWGALATDEWEDRRETGSGRKCGRG